jgi:FkbM family methyltransferase
MSIINRLVGPGDTVVDVGANVGAISLAASTAVGPSGRVISIEPHPRTFGYLQQNIRLNRRENIRALNCAVGATAGTLSFSDLDADDRNAVIDRGGLQVRVETLDALLDDRPEPIALLKVDVEGFEKYVFEGARRVLERTACVYFEADERNYGRYGYSTGEIITMLTQHGFHTVRTSLAGIERVDISYVATGLENLIAVRDPAHLHRRWHERH